MPRTCPDNATNICECGNRKVTYHPACSRCAYLDGRTVGQFELIQALREAADGETLENLAEATGRHRDAVDRGVRVLERVGRVARLEDVHYDGQGRPAVTFRLVDRGVS